MSTAPYSSWHLHISIKTTLGTLRIMNCSDVVAVRLLLIQHVLGLSRRTVPFLLHRAQLFSLLQVFIDDDLVFSASVPYPRHMTEPLTQCRIGWNFDGQTSGVLIFSGSAELITVRSMLARLASHVDASSGEVFGDRSSVLDPDLWDDPSTISSHERLKRKLFGSECRIFAALLPGRTINGQCLEPHNGHHALLRGNSTHAWIIHTAQDIVRSIGGSPILISLAHQLLSGGSETPAPRAGPNSFIGQNLDTVLSVLHSFLDGNVLNQVRILNR